MKTEKEIYSLCEAVADIMGVCRYIDFKTYDSRELVSLVITWAKEFDATYPPKTWEEMDYLETIYDFTILQISKYQK